MKYMCRHLSKEDMQMSLSIREIASEATMTYHLTPVNITIIKKREDNKYF
jgi:hypothetical protein